MALTITEASAVFDLLHWLGYQPLAGYGRDVDDDRAAAALALLGEHAGRTLQISVRPDEARTAIERLAGRLVAADSDGAAQAVCRALEDHTAHGGAIPWPSIRRPLDQWRALHAAANRPPARVELDGQTSIEDHLG